MRIYASCFQCADWEASSPEEFIPPESRWIDIGEITDDAVASGKCSRGHAINVVIQAARHVLLFDSACLALMDGYYREAIGSFAASLERFHEFGVRVLCRHLKVKDEVVKATWKSVAKRSERQLGAFHFLYAVHTNEPQMEWAHEKLRNNVIHDGKLPTQEDAFEYGEAVYSRIMGVTEELRRSAPDALDREATMQLINRAVKIGSPGEPRMTVGSGTSPVALEVWRNPRPAFAEALRKLNVFPMWMHRADRVRASAIAAAAGVSSDDFLDALRLGRLVPHIQEAVRETREDQLASIPRKERSEGDG